MFTCTPLGINLMFAFIAAQYECSFQIDILSFMAHCVFINIELNTTLKANSISAIYGGINCWQHSSKVHFWDIQSENYLQLVGVGVDIEGIKAMIEENECRSILEIIKRFNISISIFFVNLKWIYMLICLLHEKLKQNTVNLWFVMVIYYYLLSYITVYFTIIELLFLYLEKILFLGKCRVENVVPSLWVVNHLKNICWLTATTILAPAVIKSLPARGFSGGILAHIHPYWSTDAQNAKNLSGPNII